MYEKSESIPVQMSTYYEYGGRKWRTYSTSHLCPCPTHFRQISIAVENFVCNLNGSLMHTSKKKCRKKWRKCAEKTRWQKNVTTKRKMFSTFECIYMFVFFYKFINESFECILNRNLSKFLYCVDIWEWFEVKKNMLIFILLTCWHTFRPSHVKSQRLIDNPNLFSLFIKIQSIFSFS